MNRQSDRQIDMDRLTKKNRQNYVHTDRLTDNKREIHVDR